jgi:hypothetical protein
MNPKGDITTMRTSLKLTNLVLAIFALAMMSMAALAADPGDPYPAWSEVSDQKAGSVLIWNFYTSNTATTDDTEINLTNTNSWYSVNVHFFFVSSTFGCAVADFNTCLTPNQTISINTSELDPNAQGYIVGVATNSFGIPINFNYLIGDEYVRFGNWHGNLGAEAISALYGHFPAANVSTDGTAALIKFDGVDYNKVARVLAEDSLPSRAGGNATLLIVNRIGGNLALSGSSIGSIFGILYDDAENALSFTTSGGCQKRWEFTDTDPRTIPRFTTFVSATRSGWVKFWTTGNAGILGASFNYGGGISTNFDGAHNLHKLTLTTDGYDIPVYHEQTCEDEKVN